MLLIITVIHLYYFFLFIIGPVPCPITQQIRQLGGDLGKIRELLEYGQTTNSNGQTINLSTSCPDGECRIQAQYFYAADLDQLANGYRAAVPHIAENHGLRPNDTFATVCDRGKSVFVVSDLAIYHAFLETVYKAKNSIPGASLQYSHYVRNGVTCDRSFVIEGSCSKAVGMFVTADPTTGELKVFYQNRVRATFTSSKKCLYFQTFYTIGHGREERLLGGSCNTCPFSGEKGFLSKRGLEATGKFTEEEKNRPEKEAYNIHPETSKRLKLFSKSQMDETRISSEFKHYCALVEHRDRRAEGAEYQNEKREKESQIGGIGLATATIPTGVSVVSGGGSRNRTEEKEETNSARSGSQRDSPAVLLSEVTTAEVEGASGFLRRLNVSGGASQFGTAWGRNTLVLPSSGYVPNSILCGGQGVDTGIVQCTGATGYSGSGGSGDGTGQLPWGRQEGRSGRQGVDTGIVQCTGTTGYSESGGSGDGTGQLPWERQEGRSGGEGRGGADGGSGDGHDETPRRRGKKKKKSKRGRGGEKNRSGQDGGGGDGQEENAHGQERAERNGQGRGRGRGQIYSGGGQEENARGQKQAERNGQGRWRGRYGRDGYPGRDRGGGGTPSMQN